MSDRHNSLLDHSLNTIVLQERVSQLKEKLKTADNLIKHLCDHEGAEGFSVYLNAMLEDWYKE